MVQYHRHSLFEAWMLEFGLVRAHAVMSLIASRIGFFPRASSE
jgi:hypothetical protein